jgi:tRNA/rRNA methyltransferase
LGLKDRFVILLVRPEKPENVGLCARAMKNTGFNDLRIVQDETLRHRAAITAVHSEDILGKAQFFSGVAPAVQDLHVVFAATAKKRKNFPVLSFQDAVIKMLGYPLSSRIGLMFGNERTGLTTEELLHSNFRFSIPQKTRQPSYNLSSAVLLTLFKLFSNGKTSEKTLAQDRPISRQEQEECICRIIQKLDQSGFLHETNRQHAVEMTHDLFGRLVMTEKDRKFLLAIFSKTLKDQ